MNRITTIAYWHSYYNRVEFNGKLSTPGFGLTRSEATDGYYEFYPGRKKKGYIRIARRCFEDEDLLCGTILHEMIHQYQYEIMEDVKCPHDKTFNSIARKMEKKYGFRVR